MLRTRVDVMKRCRAMRAREQLEREHAPRLLINRAETECLSQARRRASARASSELNYRSLSSNDVEAETALAQENEYIFRSATGETEEALPASAAVTEEDRAMRDTLNMLAIPPVDAEQEKRHMEVVKELEEAVDGQRAKATPAAMAAIDRMFKAGKDYADHLPIAHVMGASYNFFAKAFIQKNAAEERKLLSGACQDFVDQENALRAASQAAEAADTNARCTTDECIVCFSDKPDGDIFAPNSGWTTLRCKHGFCTDCLNQWTSTGSHTCPLCRAPIFTAYGASQSQPASNGLRPSLSLGVDDDDDDDDNAPMYRPALSLGEDDDDEPVYRGVVFRSTSAREDEDNTFRSMTPV